MPSLLHNTTAGQELKAAKFNHVLKLGQQAPAWKDLPGVDDRKHSLADFAKAKVVVLVFTCNHCPVAKAYEDRLLSLAKNYQPRGVQVVAINVNRNEADRLPKMKERAKSRGYSFPYLYDDSQKTGRSYGATVTPHFFVLDDKHRIAYMGAFDDHMAPQEVTKQYVIDAVDNLLAGKPVAVREAIPRGCEIQYESE